MQGGKEKTGTGAPVHFFFILSVITEHLKAGLLERERKEMELRREFQQCGENYTK